MNFSGEAPQLPWYALQVRLRYEAIAATCLGERGYEFFLPTYRCRRQWSDRIKELELPLFAGYLFCRFNAGDRVSILKTPRVISVVSLGKGPVPVDEAEIAALRTLVTSGAATQPWPYIRIGQKVRITHGALCGLEGILESFKGRHRIVVSVSLLQRSVAAEIDDAWVVPVPPASSYRQQPSMQLTAR